MIIIVTLLQLNQKNQKSINLCFIVIVTKPAAEIVDMTLFKINTGTDALKPKEWFNIPAPVVDAISILIVKLDTNMDKIISVQGDLRRTQQ